MVKTALVKNLVRLSWLKLDTAQATKSECSMKQHGSQPVPVLTII